MNIDTIVIGVIVCLIMIWAVTELSKGKPKDAKPDAATDLGDALTEAAELRKYKNRLAETTEKKIRINHVIKALESRGLMPKPRITNEVVWPNTITRCWICRDSEGIAEGWSDHRAKDAYTHWRYRYVATKLDLLTNSIKDWN